MKFFILIDYPEDESSNDESAQVQDQDQDDAGYLSANTISSSEHNLFSFSFLLNSDDHIQSQPGATTSTATTTAAATAFTKRTRSGTIVPSSHHVGNIVNNTNTNDPPGTRRTRSGTLVGPSLDASGSAVQLVVGNGNLPFRRTRERSGTILACPSPAGARRTRGGFVTDVLLLLLY